MIKKKYSVILYWLIIIALLAMFFTNDFGLVDLHKTSVVVAVGVDTEESEVIVTAQVAVPQPSQSGDNIQYAEVQGRGLTIADCLNEINSKTGFYPKLLSCKLILLGEECQSKPLFKVLGCFFRRNYSELTALVAMCKGKASEMLALPATISPENSTAMQRALSEELKKSANVSSVNLKELAKSGFGVSKACYMPFIEANVEGTSEGGGNGDNVGGESGSQGGQGGQGSQQGGGSGGQESGGQSGQSSQSGQQGSGGGRQMEFTARKTAVFTDGNFAGLLNEQQSFALNVLKNEIRLAVLPCDADGVHYTVGLKNVGSGVNLKVSGGVPKLTVSFGALAQIQGAAKILEPDSVRFDDVVKPEILQAAEGEIRNRMEELLKHCRETGCDLFGATGMLYKYHTKYYEAFRDDILTRMEVEYKIKIKSLN